MQARPKVQLKPTRVLIRKLSLAFALISPNLYAQPVDTFDLTEEERTVETTDDQGQISQERIDNKSRRPVLRISEARRRELNLPDLGPEVLWVANFFEEANSNKILAIPLDAISTAEAEVVDRSKYNPKGRGFWQKLLSVGPHIHVQMRVNFTKPVLVFSQESDPATGLLINNAPEVVTLDHITFSVGGLRAGKEFNVAKAMGRSYKKALVMVGDKGAYRDLLNGSKILPFRLNLSSETVSDFLTMAADESTRLRVSQSYSPAKDGCLAVILDFLGRILYGRPLLHFPFSWPSSAKGAMAEFKAMGISFEPLPEIKAAKFKNLRGSDKGAYGPDHVHIYTRIDRAVGACAAGLGRALTRTSRIFIRRQ